MGNLSDKRLAKEQVRKMLTRMLHHGGDLRFTEYCEKRMLERGISALTVVNILDRGTVKDAEEYTHGGYSQWRYRVETSRYRVIVSFEIENEIIVINAIDFASYLSDTSRITKKKGE
jgi:mRNA-degrading endonuclease RelE of RelBE toxin-antitoxin system